MASGGEHAEVWREYRDPSGRPYYHNQVTGETTWVKPVEAAAVAAPAVPPVPVQLPPGWYAYKDDNGNPYYYNAATKETSWTVPTAPADRASSSSRDIPQRSTSAAYERRQTSASARPSENPPHNEQTDDANDDEDDEDEDFEERKNEFKAMLHDFDVQPSSTLELEAPKLVFDKRYKALRSMAIRREAFDEYCREKLHSNALEKLKKKKDMRAQFQSLLEEANLTARDTYESFCKKYKSDSRMLKTERLRKQLFDDHVAPLLQQEAEKRERAKKSFLSLLEENEHRIRKNTVWSDIKDDLRDDDRYESVARREREDLFLQYRDEMLERLERDQTIRKQEESNKRIRIEENKRIHDELLQSRRREALSKFNELLRERITRPLGTWEEVRPRLASDPRFSAVTHAFDDEDAADRERLRLFELHVEPLAAPFAEEFRNRCRSASNLIGMTLKEFLESLGNDDMLKRFPLAKQRNPIFNKAREDAVDQAIRDFKDALYGNREISEELSEKEVISIIRKMPEFKAFTSFKKDRDRVIDRFLDRLEDDRRRKRRRRS